MTSDLLWSEKRGFPEAECPVGGTQEGTSQSDTLALGLGAPGAEQDVSCGRRGLVSTWAEVQDTLAALSTPSPASGGTPSPL